MLWHIRLNVVIFHFHSVDLSVLSKIDGFQEPTSQNQWVPRNPGAHADEAPGRMRRVAADSVRLNRWRQHDPFYRKNCIQLQSESQVPCDLYFKALLLLRKQGISKLCQSNSQVCQNFMKYLHIRIRYQVKFVETVKKLCLLLRTSFEVIHIFRYVNVFYSFLQLRFPTRMFCFLRKEDITFSFF